MTNRPTMLAPVDAVAFRNAMGRFPTGVALMTQGSGVATEAMTVNCLTSVSLDPLLLLVGVRATCRIRPRVAEGGSFAINVLTVGQRDLADLFARRDRPAGEDASQLLRGTVGATGNIVIPSAVVCFECVLHAEYPSGDHVLFLGQVMAIHGDDSDRQPLVFHRSRYTTPSGPL